MAYQENFRLFMEIPVPQQLRQSRVGKHGLDLSTRMFASTDAWLWP
jgi:hypothetical protein